MTRLAVINVVGLTESLIGEATPRIAGFCQSGATTIVKPAFPAVTCAGQSNYLTGKLPSEHGIVGNGWYNRELAEIQFWKQSNHLVHGPKIWDVLRPADDQKPLRTANCFWWFNMYSSVDYSITPRPIYRADGGKIFDVYSWPYSIREEIKKDLGAFPFLGFWGPAAGVKTPQGSADCATRWIADSAKWIEKKFSPDLNLIYLPHLDYNLQRHGPYAPGSRRINPAIVPDLNAIDSIVGDLIDFFHARDVRILLLSEYGITNVDTPIHLNRIFRGHGWLTLKDEIGHEILDAGASRAFAVADHQVAHIYLNDLSLKKSVRDILEKTPGIERVLGNAEKATAGVGHPRAGDLIAVAAENTWFTYYYWDDDTRAPDFARTVDIHRKPGYDPAELFIDPGISMPRLKIAQRLLQKKLGFRMLMDLIPLDATLVKGSHGRQPTDKKDWPVIVFEKPENLDAREIESTDVFNVIRRHFAQ
ncbi:MAG TPA: nucleotide pyrophosphatase/phosphodiesterase family protein [Verrucomicrobiae bacterium]|jgi:predicted AlkP superfamily pyrophosphatase or phosphodiesterase|nr:nucleotide pyrophosphatase/phosphodiesterase family protein [Verrucomicrobiae bacterium]